jgi:formate dehydrogenase subunit delta
MESENMVHMANQIALFFASYPKEEAVAGVTDHLQKFWEPRMRKQIIGYVAEGGHGLHDLALEAVKRLH